MKEEKMVESSLSDDISQFISHSQCTMIAGGIAGCVGKTITAPLSRLTILLQVGPLSSPLAQPASSPASVHSRAGQPGRYAMLPGSSSQLSKSSGLIHASRRVFIEEGILSFWKGNLTSVIHRFPYSAINFTVYDELQMLTRRVNGRETPMTRFISGSIAGGVACFACYPLDLVRTQLTVLKTPVAGTKRSVYGSISTTIQTIIESEGITGLYRGLMISLAVTIPTFGISFCVYGTVKEHLLSPKSSSSSLFNPSFFKDPVSGHLNAYGSMFSGAMSGIISSILLFPADSIRRRIQVEKVITHQIEVEHYSIHNSCPINNTVNTNMNNNAIINGNINCNTNNINNSSNNSNTNNTNNSSSNTNTNTNTNNTNPHCNNSGTNSKSGAINEVIRVIRAHGIKGLYRGLVPELLKVTPMVSITFCVYEFTYDLLSSSIFT